MAAIAVRSIATAAPSVTSAMKIVAASSTQTAAVDPAATASGIGPAQRAAAADSRRTPGRARGS